MCSMKRRFIVYTSFMEFDYSSLHKPITTRDIEEYLRYTKSRYSYRTRKIASTIFCLVIFTLIAGWLYYSSFYEITILTAYVVLVFLLAIFVIYKAHSSLFARARVMRFARANNLQTEFDISSSSTKGSIFNKGDNRKVLTRLRQPDAWEIGNYMYMTGQRLPLVYRYGYAKLTLPDQFPHIVLEKAQEGVGSFLFRSEYATNEQTIPLGRGYVLYAPENYTDHAWYAFPPNILLLLDRIERFNQLELIDNQLILSVNGSFSIDSEPQLRLLLDTLLEVGKSVYGDVIEFSKADPSSSITTNSGRHGGSLERRRGYGTVVRAILLILTIIGLIYIS